MLKNVSFILMALCCSTRLSAGFNYEVSFNSAPGAGNTVVELLLGGSAAIPVFIHETWDGTGSPTSPLGTSGLKKALVSLNRTSGDFSAITAVAGDAAFDSSNLIVLPDFGQVAVSKNPGVTGTNLSPGLYRLRIASITFTAITPGSTNFGLLAPPPDGSFEIGNEVAPTFGTLTIVAVPEPNSAMLAILASGLLLLRRSRKRGFGVL
jgi:hypothetical protein